MIRARLDLLCCWTLLLCACMGGTACSGAGNGPGTGAQDRYPDPANRLAPDRAQTPFNAEELRKGGVAGRRIRVAMHVPGEPVRYRVVEFLGGDEKSTKMRTWSEGEDGELVGEKQERSVDWQDLQRHASFPSIQTLIEEDELETPIGTLDCWVYTVTTMQKGKPIVQRHWFAKDLPGPPVRTEQFEDGERVLWVEIVENVLPEGG